MLETVLIWCVVVFVALTLVAIVMELRRLGDILEAVNHAVERVVMELKRR